MCANNRNVWLNPESNTFNRGDVKMCDNNRNAWLNPESNKFK